MKQKLLALAAVAALSLTLLTGCGKGKADPSPSVAPTPTPTPTASAPAEKTKVNVAMLNGPTGMGAAKLMADAEAGETALDYTFSVFTANDQVTAALTNGEVDIAAIATNVAANYYNKTKGSVQLAALNTYGVLKILQAGEGEEIEDLSDLAGESLYATGKGANPEFVLNYLLTENGLDPEKDVDIQWVTPEEVTQALLSGKTRFAMLPVPAATAAMAKSQGSVKLVLDLNEVWNEAATEGKLTMGCVVVRKEFAEQEPEAVRTFLEEYERSIAYMADPESLTVSSDLNPGQLLEKYGIVPSAAIGEKALPQANLTFLAGAEAMRNAIQGYYEVLYAADPASIGGGIPDDGFYFE